ncbi:MAG: restriction endonuclease [Candidatus Eisenbacteria bacterium]|uniref:site-specific DNA-methyltransferase (adenine-specific) n=1 Tax=Eiseniibacteriota bacterium TaxID=2212470 RepID=A0A933S9V5_UNCEI|nr:restriction endonuclease [Candidatus Eisenbacteria bacterium]
MRQRFEWLRFAEPAGPFLSPPVLVEVWPQGMAAPPTEKFEWLRDALSEWRDAVSGPRPDLALHRQWCEHVVRDFLGWPSGCVRALGAGVTLPTAQAPLGRETLSPDLLLQNPEGHPDGQRVRMLVSIVTPRQQLDRPLQDRTWRASPTDRMVELLRGTGVRLGLVTNGAEWTFVQLVPGEMPGVAHWDVDLWLDERDTLTAFYALFESSRFFAVAAEHTLEAMLDRSRSKQHLVTDQLGKQVRRAVEVLVQALDTADRTRQGQLLSRVPPVEVYEGALTVMMRLVFLFAAEERGLMGEGSESYARDYAVSTLREQLREAADQHGEEVLESRYDAWGRLLATFRLIHEGARHEALAFPAYGGSLFDPDRFAFLEGREAGTHWRDTAAQPLAVSNRTVLHLLTALQELEVEVPGGRERRQLSFRELDVEDVGHVYEGLLDHTAVRAAAVEAPILGLGGSLEPEVPLPKLEALEQKGRKELLDYLEEQTGRTRKTLEKALAQPVVRDEARARRSCGNDEQLYVRVKPWLGLVRDDTLEAPVVIRAGSVYVTAGDSRRTSGTHYTPRTLTEPIVRHALEPVVYRGPAEGLPEAEWQLRSARELLTLKVCDFAMGSGAFLVQACRYLAERLLDAWSAAESAAPGAVRVTPEGEPSTGAAGERLVPLDDEERRVVAMRLVADRCLYGVDRNPMAVEMAKLSLWLVTLQKDRPFNFLDHALRAGDSLLGVTRPEQLRYFDLGEAAGQKLQTFERLVAPALTAASEKRRELEGFPVLSAADAERKAALLAEADARLAELRALGDLLVGATLAGHAKDVNAKSVMGAARDRAADLFDTPEGSAERTARLSELRAEGQRLLDAAKPPRGMSRRPFHWAIEFPEVFEQGGFDSMVANPPFLGGQKITGPMGSDYRTYLVKVVAHGATGSADLSAYFMRRVAELLRDGGAIGMIATNTIAQGDTREVGLDTLLADGYVCPRAVASQKWPGVANLEVALLWVRRGAWAGGHVLDGNAVGGITPYLTVPGSVEGKPYRLAANAGKSFQGSIVLGMGFVLEPEEAQALIARDPRNRDVLFPYLNGEDLNSRWDQSPSRWVINFHDWPLDRASAPEGYEGPVAAEYPECLRLIEERARAERERLAAGDATARDRARRWWQFARPTMGLYAAVHSLDSVLVACRVTKFIAHHSANPAQVFDVGLNVIVDAELWAPLESTIYEAWVRAYASTLESRVRYVLTDTFEVFPFHLASLHAREVRGQLVEHRLRVYEAEREGLTATYNRFHSPAEKSPDIEQLRALHVELDRAVSDAYGWTDLALGHDFHATKQGTRFTLSDPARREVLARLLQLNHDRHAEELAQGLHDKPAKKSAAKSRAKSPKPAPPKPEAPDLFS